MPVTPRTHHNLITLQFSQVNIDGVYTAIEVVQNSLQTYRFDPVDGKTGRPPRKDGQRGQIFATPL